MERQLNFGIIGMNEGNGHPFSYAAIFNGYEADHLKARCPFPLIRDYLPKEHRNEVHIAGATVSHVWCQTKALAEDISAVAKIPFVVSDKEEMIGEVDGIIIARDDPENHLELARPFLGTDIPLFFDKLLSDQEKESAEILKCLGPNQRIMTGSGARYSSNVVAAKKARGLKDVKSVHGVSRVSWQRYGSHLLDPITEIFGYGITRVRALSSKSDHDIVQVEYENGLNVILECIENTHLPIGFRCFSDTSSAITVLFDDYFNCYLQLMKKFTLMAKHGICPIPDEDMLVVNRTLLAGLISKESGGDWINLKEVRLR